MKAAPETGPNRSGTRYSAADKLKAVKLYFEEGYQAKDIARELGIGKSSLGKWIREYREKGSGAFTSPPEKSAAAAEKSDPAREFVRAQILEHKAAHPDHGVKRITQIFRRFLGLPVKTHEVRSVLQAHPSSSTATTSRPRRPPAPMRFFERRSPNELWHTDVMYFIMPNHEKVFVIGYLDDYSRYVVALDLFHRQTVGNTIDLLKKACGDYTFPKEILTDGGRQFVSWTGNNQFGTYLRNHQIKHTVCRTHHPQTNGKMERFWRTLRQEFFDKAKISSFDELREQLALYIRHYNFQRPHQGIGGLTPADRFFEIETTVKRQLAEKIADNTLELALKGHVRKPFMMVGRVGDSCVSILEKKGRISMQIDGVEQPTGETSPLIISDENITQQLDKQPIMENIENGEDPSDSSGKIGAISNDRIADAAVDGAGKMQGSPLDLDGENQCERGLPPVFGAAPAGGTLGVACSGGNAESSGDTSEGTQGVGDERVLTFASSRETAGSQDVAERKETSPEERGETVGNTSGETSGPGATSLPPGATAQERESWTIASFSGDFSISI